MSAVIDTPNAGTSRRKSIPSSQRAVILAFLLASLVAPALAQASESSTDYSNGPKFFPSVFQPYRPQRIPDTGYDDPVDLTKMAQNGRLELSLELLRTAVLRNNLEIAASRYADDMAETDLLRARGGGAPRGAPGVRIPSGLFTGALGAGVGDLTTAGGSSGAGGITGNARQVVARPRGTFDPSLALNLSVDRTSSPLNTLVVAGIPAVTTSTTALQARFAQAFTTGTSISISFNNQRQTSTQRFLRFNPATVSSFGLTVTHQLLSGAGVNVNRRFLTVAETGKKIAAESVRQQEITVLAQAESLYWDLVAARDNARVAEKSVEVAQQLLRDNGEREEIGTVSKMEVFTAAAEVSARQRDLVAALTIYEQRQADVKLLLTRDYSKTLDSIELEPADSLPQPDLQPPPSLQTAVELAISQRPELRQSELNLKNQDVAIRYTRNLLKPTFVVFGMVNSSGLYGNRLLDTSTPPVLVTGGLWDAFRQVSRFNYPEYAFGFSLQIPLLNRNAQADYARANIEKQQAETTEQQLRHRIQLEVRNALVALNQSKAQVDSARKTVELRAESLTNEQERLVAGLSTPYEIIRRQRDLMTAQYQEVRARSNYAKARVDLARATGTTAGQ